MSRVLRPDVAAPPHDLIDVHVHLGHSTTGELYYPRLEGEEWLELAAEARVRRAFAFPPLLPGYREANDALADWAATTGGAVAPFARLGGWDVPWTTRQLWQLRRKLRARVGRRRPPDVSDLSRFAGVKLLPHLDGLPGEETFEELNALGLPIVIHGGIHSPPDWIESTVLPRTTGTVVVAHLGCFPAGEPELRAAVDLAGRHDRVHLDTSGVWLAAFLTYAAERVPHKMLFGSDAPLTHPLVAWHHLRCAVHDDDTLADIGWRNAEALFDQPADPTPSAATN